MSQYARATEIMLTALNVPATDRHAFVVREAHGDDALQRDVFSLLDAHTRSEAFLETPVAHQSDVSRDGGAIGQRVGNYRILGLLGEGGMGVVYRAEDTRLGRTVALKAIAPQFTHDPHVRERLRREARAAAALNHPGIAVVYALEEIDDRLYLVAEHIQGETLRDAIATGPLPLADVLTIGRRLADALAAAHDSGVIHRDLKPENVMRTREGGAKILDFGLAKAIGAEPPNTAAGGPALTMAGAVFGTPAYMSPEQLRGEPASAASDIFALGVLLAEISSGRHPFGGDHGTATMAKALSAEPDLTNVPAALRPVITGCLAKIADARFCSAHEVRKAIDTVARGETPRRIDHTAEFWWWQFHQAGACFFSATLIVCVWLASGHLPPKYAHEVLSVAVIGGAAATTLRLYILFSARMRPDERTPRGATYAARAFDEALAAAAFLAGFHQTATHPVAAALLMSAAVVMTLIALVVEPATARAAKR